MMTLTVGASLYAALMRVGKIAWAWPNYMLYPGCFSILPAQIVRFLGGPGLFLSALSHSCQGNFVDDCPVEVAQCLNLLRENGFLSEFVEGRLGRVFGFVA